VFPSLIAHNLTPFRRTRHPLIQGTRPVRSRHRRSPARATEPQLLGRWAGHVDDRRPGRRRRRSRLRLDDRRHLAFL